MSSDRNRLDKNPNSFELSNDSIEDMKAAFICITKSLNENLESPEDLAKGKLYSPFFKYIFRM